MHSKNQRRHGSPCPSRAPLVPMKPKVSVAPSPGDTLAFRVPREYPHSRFTKAPLAVYPPKGARGKTCLSLPVVSLEKMPCLGRAEGAAHLRVNCSSSIPSSSSPSPSSLKPSLTPPAPHRPQEKLLNGRGPATPRSSTTTNTASPSPSSLDRRPSPARSPLDKRPSSTPSPSPLDRRPSPLPSPSLRPSASPLSPLDRKHQNGTKGSKPHRRLSGRVFDPNKHCGVQDPESKRPCTRSLTCKTHSLTHRRAVPGRRKQFDILLAEHKSRAKEKDGGKEKEGGPSKKESQGGTQTTPSQDTTTPSMPTHCHNGRTVSTLKLRLANAHIPRVPGGGGPAALSSSPALPPASTSASGSDATPSWVRVAADSRLSSDEGDGETAEDPDRPACHYSPRHPRPLGCCAFSSRLMGRGHYVFDRRWDRMRLALHCMVEQHVNAQMWRKVPLAADSFLSSPGTPTTPQPPGSTPHSLSSSPSVLTPPLLSSPSSFPPSSEGFSLVSYTAAFPQSGAGLFSFRDPPQPLAPVSALGKPRNGTTKPSRPPREDSGGAKRRKTIPSLDTPKRNGNSSYPPATPLLSPGFPSLPGKKKSSLGRGGIGGPGIRGEDWFSSPDPITPYPHTRDPPLPPPLSPLPPPSSPLPPPYSPLAYGGGAEGRKRRSPSSYGGKPSKMTKAAAGLESIFRRSSTGLLSSGPESPRQPKLHH